MTIPAFWAGVLCVIFAEMLIFFVTILIYALGHTSKTHENTSKNDRSE